MDKISQTTYQSSHGKALLILILASVQMAAATAVHAQDTINTLETPPPLTDEELSRSINTAPTRVEADTTLVDQNTDASPGASDVVTEYRVQQKLYLIEVNPRLGSSYYLSDSDGDGSLEEYRQSTESDTKIGKWRLGSW